MSSTTPLKIAWATIVGPIRRSRNAAAPNAMPTPDSTITRPTLPRPRTGSTCAASEQHALEDDRQHRRRRAPQPAQHHAAEHHLLHDRRGDDGGDHDRHDVRPVRLQVGDAVGVVGDRHAEADDDGGDHDLCAERREPDHRAPPEVGPPWREADVGPQRIAPPAPADVPAPQHRRAVSKDREDQDVDDERPLEVGRALRARTSRRSARP